MFALSAVLLFFGHHGTKALPMLLPSGTEDQAQAASLSCPLRRTVINIIWGCLTTIFLSTWVAIHPNIPPPGRFNTSWRRVQLMLWTLIMPEYILVWAARQWLAAWEIRDTYTTKKEYSGKKRTLRHFVWTVKRWFGERELKPEYKHDARSEWTMIHGHFLIMGGFVLTDREKNVRFGPISFRRFQELIADKKIDFPAITNAEITDKSKGNHFSKVITLLQVSWFVLQCIVRHAQGLVLTELELVTIAITSLSTFTFCFWLHKPLCVQEPLEIYLKSKVDAEKDDEQETESQPEYIESSNVTASQVVKLAYRVLEALSAAILEIIQYPFLESPLLALYGWFLLLPAFTFFLLLFPIFGLFPLAVVFLLWIITPTSKIEVPSENRGLVITKIVSALRRVRHKLTTSISEVVGTRLKRVFDTESLSRFLLGWFFVLPALFLLLIVLLGLFLLFFIPFSVVFFIFASVFSIIATSVICSESDHVPIFYAPKTKNNRYSRIIVFAIFGAFYGGIHCIGWNYAYPTKLERMIWRIMSLIITTIPIMVAPLDFIVTNRTPVSHGRFENLILVSLDLIITVILVVYVTARLLLIALALELLRKQPPTAYLAVEWIKFIPHVG